MRRLDLLVVSENVASTDTTQSGAHVLLPAAAWGEKDGTVTNSERRISRQRALPAAGRRSEARLVDRWPKSRGGSASARVRLSQRRPTIFREHAALSAFENDGTRDFDLSRSRGIEQRRLRRAVARAMADPARRCGGAGAHVRRWRLLHARPAGPVRRDRHASDTGGARPRYPLHPQHRPHARPVAHDDAHRALAAAGQPSPGTALWR